MTINTANLISRRIQETGKEDMFSSQEVPRPRKLDHLQVSLLLVKECTILIAINRLEVDP